MGPRCACCRRSFSISAGWRVVEALHPEIEVYHLNEGHAAFAVIERARRLARRSGLCFGEALWATRAGNVFTTHTPVASAFDRFAQELLGKYLRPFMDEPDATGIALADILALGRTDTDHENDHFNMAYLAVRGSLSCFAVSRLHSRVSRRISSHCFRAGPECEVPIKHITNGVHFPSWDSAEADRYLDCGLRQGPVAGHTGRVVRSDQGLVGRGSTPFHVFSVEPAMVTDTPETYQKHIASSRRNTWERSSPPPRA